MGGGILGMIKNAYHGWLSMMASEAPFFSLASPPNPKPTTAHHQIGIRQWEENEDILTSGSEVNG